jgi:hypothetical protein
VTDAVGRSSDASARRPRSGTPRGKTPVASARPPDYIVVGHICGDIQRDGSVSLGGTAYYSAIAAAKLGWRVGILTRGAYGVTIGGHPIPDLDLGDSRIQIVVEQAEWPTFFINDYSSGRRTQQITRWAGPIDLRGLPPNWRNPRVMHFGPVAQEIDVRQVSGINPGFLGTTPQGWMRDWPRGSGGKVQNIPLRLPRDFMGQLDCIVVNDEEFVQSRDVIEAIGKTGYGVVTLGSGGAQAFTPNGLISEPAFPLPVDDPTGAGDVFAATFFNRMSEPGRSVRDSLRYANAAAGLSVAGEARHIPSRQAIKRLLDRHAVEA